MVENNIPYEIGTIKLTWIDPHTYELLNGQMFDTVDQALATAKTKKLGQNWLVFELVRTDGNRYEWKVLPYGKHRGYISGMKFRDNLVLRFMAIALMCYGAYCLGKLILKSKKLNA